MSRAGSERVQTWKQNAKIDFRFFRKYITNFQKSLSSPNEHIFSAFISILPMKQHPKRNQVSSVLYNLHEENALHCGITWTFYIT